MKVWRCPFCGKEMPPGEEPAAWFHCGEVGRAELEEEDELETVVGGDRTGTGANQ